MTILKPQPLVPTQKILIALWEFTDSGISEGVLQAPLQIAQIQNIV